MILFKHISFLFLALVLASAPALASQPTTQPLIIHSNGTQHQLQVELALTPEQQRQGLSHRASLPADHGMLFVFPQAEMQYFWMKDTLIPLDMIFADSAGSITHIHANAQPGDLTVVSSQQPARMVLELNGGRAAQLGLKIGDKIAIPAAAQGLTATQALP